jgi:hypothetical protein
MMSLTEQTLFAKFQGLISSDLRLRILSCIKEVKTVMDVSSMREMYHQFVVQEKQSSHLEIILEELSRPSDIKMDRKSRSTRVRPSPFMFCKVSRLDSFFAGFSTAV